MSMTGLHKITDRILADAQAEADRILAEAEQEAAAMRADYEARAEQLRETLSAQAEEEAKALIARAKSTAATQKRNLLLQCKGELVDRVFEDTLKGVRALEGEKYTDLLVGLLSACIHDQLDMEQKSRDLYGDEDVEEIEQYEVLMNVRDRDRYGSALIEGARKRLMGKAPQEKLERLTLSGTAAPIDGGFILRCGRIEINCTFALLFAQLREKLEAEVGEALFAPKKQNG